MQELLDVLQDEKSRVQAELMKKNRENALKGVEGRFKNQEILKLISELENLSRTEVPLHNADIDQIITLVLSLATLPNVTFLHKVAMTIGRKQFSLLMGGEQKFKSIEHEARAIQKNGDVHDLANLLVESLTPHVKGEKLIRLKAQMLEIVLKTLQQSAF